MHCFGGKGRYCADGGCGSEGVMVGRDCVLEGRGERERREGVSESEEEREERKGERERERERNTRCAVKGHCRKGRYCVRVEAAGWRD